MRLLLEGDDVAAVDLVLTAFFAHYGKDYWHPESHTRALLDRAQQLQDRIARERAQGRP